MTGGSSSSSAGGVGSDIELGTRTVHDNGTNTGSGGVKDQVREQIGGVNNAAVGKRCKSMGYRPKHPVALFNSLSGCVIEVIESTEMPSWTAKSGHENALWVDINKVTSSVLGNAFGKGEKNAEKMRKLRWKEELIHMMDADGDGEVQPDEVLEFLTNHEKLKNDPTIQRFR